MSVGEAVIACTVSSQPIRRGDRWMELQWQDENDAQLHLRKG
jgi:hypothetical protein